MDATFWATFGRTFQACKQRQEETEKEGEDSERCRYQLTLRTSRCFGCEGKGRGERWVKQTGSKDKTNQAILSTELGKLGDSEATEK